MKRVLMLLVLSLPVAHGAARPDEQKKDEVPAWVKEDPPDWLQPYVGKRGLPEPLARKPGPLGSSVAGLDHWQANHFIVYRKETARFLYETYTPLQVGYRQGTLPGYEAVVKKYLASIDSDREKAVELLTRALPEVCRHPKIPPVGKRVAPDRNLDDEVLLASGGGWCNEQARVFVRLCQVSGIPARIVFLFYADQRSGHVVAEFHAGGRWCLADTSWLCVFPNDAEQLLSAAEAHAPDGWAVVEQAYRTRFKELAKLPDADLGPRDAARQRQSLADRTPDRFSAFGIINYPLPGSPRR